ncbi:MAG: ABC transporter permease [Pseudomonadota bacterium]
MRIADYFTFAFSSLHFSQMRSLLTALGIAVGIAAVILLTSLGGGARDYILGEFTQFGTHIIGVVPGRTTTMGISGAVISNVRPLSVEDAESLRSIKGVRTSVPVSQGNAPVEAGKRSRWVYVIGVNHEVPQTWQIHIGQGEFLPPDPHQQTRNLAVIGHRLKQELFPQSNPLGQRIRIGQQRFRVIGVMESKGQVLGFDLDDAVYIPVNRALSLFNRDSLMEIDLLYDGNYEEQKVVDAIRKRLIERHGSEDFTIITQNDMLQTLGSILELLTAVVAALGGISLLVGGVGIFTIMSIAVNERIREIGLLRALGASQAQISLLFLLEAAALSGAGGLAGMAAGLAIAWMLHLALPALPVAIAWDYLLLAGIIAIITGVLSGLLPARRAAALPPVEALRSE